MPRGVDPLPLTPNARGAARPGRRAAPVQEIAAHAPAEPGPAAATCPTCGSDGSWCPDCNPHPDDVGLPAAPSAVAELEWWALEGARRADREADLDAIRAAEMEAEMHELSDSEWDEAYAGSGRAFPDWS